MYMYIYCILCVLGTHHCSEHASCEAYCFLWPSKTTSCHRSDNDTVQNRTWHSQPWFILLKFFVAQTNYRFIALFVAILTCWVLFENRITSPLPLDHHKSHYWPFTGGFWPCSALFLTETARRGEPRWRAAAEPHPGNLWRRRQSIPRSTCGKGRLHSGDPCGNWGIHQQFNGDVASRGVFAKAFALQILIWIFWAKCSIEPIRLKSYWFVQPCQQYQNRSSLEPKWNHCPDIKPFTRCISMDLPKELVL